MELIKVVSARNAIDALSGKEDINAHLAYWMTKFVVKTESEAEFYSAEMRKLIDKYSEKTEKNELSVPAESIEEFNRAIDALNKTDVEAPDIRFSLSELSAELKLSMKQIYPLLDFIDENK